jgi:hypothetical protein
LLTEFKRVLKPTGFLVISTPDKAVYSDKLRNQNPYHVKELLRAEFESLLAEYFQEVKLLGQKLGFHSLIWPLQENAASGYRLQQESAAGIKSLQQPSAEPVYLLAVCASSPVNLPATDQGLFLFDDESESVYQHYNHEIRRNLETGAILQQLEARVASLQAELAAALNRTADDAQPRPEKHWLSRVLQKVKG